jgi:hypothetical protein
VDSCELCRPAEVVLENELAYVRPDSNRAPLGQSHSLDGYNIGVNIGKAGGQTRMHVHVHLIPRYAGDVADPRGGIRCVLKQ